MVIPDFAVWAPLSAGLGDVWCWPWSMHCSGKTSFDMAYHNVTHFNELKAHLATRPAVLNYSKTPMIPVSVAISLLMLPMLVTNSDLSSYATNASNAHPGTRISPELPARLVPYVPTFIWELFVVAWACQYPHPHNLHTPQVEFGHAYLKRFIVNSTGNLLSVFKLLALVFDIQINHVHESICRDTVKTLVNVHKLFVPLLGKILTFASKECLCQFKRLEDLDPSEPCSHTVTIGLGIPCAHHIMQLMEVGHFVAPEDSHLQWHLRYNPEFRKTEEEEINLDKELKMITISLTHKQPTTVADLLAQMKGIAAGTHKAVTIQAPQVKKQTKGRPSTKAEQLTTTKRKPLAFEVVEANLKHYRRYSVVFCNCVVTWHTTCVVTSHFKNLIGFLALNIQSHFENAS
ncbi:hypothetical protein PSTG_14716 [Puccinia striiformis f. sp. tritici PST-78]|uniref:Uncharacterized protein n=1 Tax=Puccinia striiformis f. sp. tritici PST-78 TaxID=1165861 RepID=A0A0L0UXT7_9BASI|nr:hypothetical protein PSTG_14716 [Puccinia striiformis f. sp. tritici PST-78]